MPYNRRRKADALIAAARLEVTWRPAPTAEEIRTRDQERFLSDTSFTTPATDEEAPAVVALQAAHSADAIALALLRMQRAQLPAPEDLAIDSGPPPRATFQGRDGRERGERFGKDRQGHERTRGESRNYPSRRDQGTSRDGPYASGVPTSDVPAPRPRREDTRPMSWFRINIGRERNADPRWLLPLICRAGGVTKSEVGAIRIEDHETRFQILAEAADQFDYLARTAKKKEGHIVRLNQDGDVSVCEAIDRIAQAPAQTPAAAAKHTDRKPTATAHKSPRNERGKPAGSGGGWHARGRQKPGENASSAAARHGEAGATRAPSKYAKKKKHRSTAPNGGNR